MHTFSHAAIALMAGLALSGAPSTGDRLSQGYSVQAPVGMQVPGPAGNDEALLPANATTLVRMGGLQAIDWHAATVQVSPVSSADAHDEPVQEGMPSRL
ncbi:hypothetical protein [Azorhizobium oxalatiphilum]|nr:hypothetical protein [Azorhizobium oxalatiphilum]